jgi:hypothetical protein
MIKASIERLAQSSYSPGKLFFGFCVGFILVIEYDLFWL